MRPSYTPSLRNHYDDGLLAPIATLISSITTLETLELSQFDLSDALAAQLSSSQPHLTRLSMGRCSLTHVSLPLSERTSERSGAPISGCQVWILASHTMNSLGDHYDLIHPLTGPQ